MGKQIERIERAKNRTLIITTIITAIATIAAGWIAGFRLPANNPKPELYEFSVDQAKYPFERTPIELREGDTVEIIVTGANATVLNCGVGDTAVLGVVNHQDQRLSVLPTANLCALIGRIGSESAPYFQVGAYTKFDTRMEGTLYLGVNDVPPERCSHEDCFARNTGNIFVRVVVTRK
jgi:hypothetical protein